MSKNLDHENQDPNNKAEFQAKRPRKDLSSAATQQDALEATLSRATSMDSAHGSSQHQHVSISIPTSPLQRTNSGDSAVSHEDSEAQRKRAQENKENAQKLLARALLSPLSLQQRQRIWENRQEALEKLKALKEQKRLQEEKHRYIRTIIRHRTIKKQEEIAEQKRYSAIAFENLKKKGQEQKEQDAKKAMFIEAISNGNLEKLKELHAKYPKIEIGQDLLDTATDANHEAVTQYLLELIAPTATATSVNTAVNVIETNESITTLTLAPVSTVPTSIDTDTTYGSHPAATTYIENSENEDDDEECILVGESVVPDNTN